MSKLSSTTVSLGHRPFCTGFLVLLLGLGSSTEAFAQAADPIAPVNEPEHPVNEPEHAVNEPEHVDLTSPPPAAPAECVPSCRAAYTCVQGSCVSLCNPPCEAGLTCTAEGTCVSNGSAVAPVAADQTAASADDLDETTWDDEPEFANDEPSFVFEPRRGAVLVARAGLLVWGSGEVESECTGSGCGDMSSESVDHDDASQFVLEADLLFHTSPKLRLGFGALFVPGSEVEPEGSTTDTELGMEVTPIAIIEGVFGRKVAGTLRAFGGVPLFFPGDDLDELDELCDEVRDQGQACDNSSGPFLGYTLGAGGGVVGQVSKSIALRGDLVLQYQSVRVIELTASESFDSLTVTSSSSTTRIWLMAGLEF